MNSPREIQAVLRNDLSTFIQRCFMELNPATKYLYNWHIDLIASKLEDVRLGKCKRLIINIPPRNLKSICASIAFPAWLLGQDPALNIICASYGQDLSSKLALDCRNVMQSSWYQALFPHTQLANTSADDFKTTKRGGRMATSVGGVLTGRGADILIIDDPMKPEEAISDTQRAAANDWFDSTAYSRLNSKKDGAIIIIMQRLHLDDLVGHVLENESWDVLSLPATAMEETTYCFNSLWGKQTHIRKLGEPLHAEREPAHILQMIRETVDEYNFSAQYQQSPVPLGGGFIKKDWLRLLEPHDFPTSFDQIVQSWDTASKATQLADYSVCTTWGSKNGKHYLLNVWRGRVDFPQLKEAFIQQYNAYKPNVILVEDKSSGTSLIQELKAAGINCIKAINPQADKRMRIYNQATQFENGSVCLPHKASWLQDYVLELTSFPTAKYDDQVDSTSQFLEHIGNAFKNSGLYDYYRLESLNKRLLG